MGSEIGSMGVGFRHVQYLEGQLARTGRHGLRQQLLRMSIEERRSLNADLAGKFSGKNFGQVDAYIRSITGFRRT